jgi:hypothetical protein
MFEAALLLFVIGFGAIIMNLYERRQDVLYGPYLRPDDPTELK